MSGHSTQLTLFPFPQSFPNIHITSPQPFPKLPATPRDIWAYPTWSCLERLSSKLPIANSTPGAPIDLNPPISTTVDMVTLLVITIITDQRQDQLLGHDSGNTSHVGESLCHQLPPQLPATAGSTG